MGGGSVPPRFVAGALVAGKFVLRARVGAGASGEVWSATNSATGALVALKLVSGSGVSPETVARFRHEASLSAALVQRNIVRIYDLVAEADGTMGLVMELLRGENARERLVRTGPLPAASAASIAIQLLDGLAHAHELRIVHRDIKPPNVFLATEPDGSVTPKLVDFGIAKTGSGKLQTQSGRRLGTPRYMSPEQVRAEGAVDGRSDLFSLMVVLYELLTGTCPFAAPFPAATLQAVLETNVKRDPRIPLPLWEVIDKGLSKNPNDRYASAEELSSALSEAVDASSVSLQRALKRSKPPPPIVSETAMPLVLPSASDPPSEPVPVRGPSETARRAVVAIVSVCATILVLGLVRSLARHAETVTPPARSAPATSAPALDIPPIPSAPASAPLETPAAATAAESPSRAPQGRQAPPSPGGTAPASRAPSTMRTPPPPRPAAAPSSGSRVLKDPGF